MGVDNAGAISQLGSAHLSMNSRASDIWERCKYALHNRTGTFKAVKIKSHATQEDLDKGLDLSWALANEIADLFAGTAADNMQLPAETCSDVQFWDYRATRCLERGIAVIQRCIAFEEIHGDGGKFRFNLGKSGVNAIAERKAKLQAAWDSCRHTFSSVKKRGGTACILCMKGPTGKTAANQMEFLHSDCIMNDEPHKPTEGTDYAGVDSVKLNEPVKLQDPGQAAQIGAGTLRRMETRVERLVKARHSLNAALEEATNDAAEASCGSGLTDDTTLQMTIKRIALARQELANAKRRKIDPEVHEFQPDNTTGNSTEEAAAPTEPATGGEPTSQLSKEVRRDTWDPGMPDHIFDFNEEVGATAPPGPSLSLEQKASVKAKRQDAIARKMAALRSKDLGDLTTGELDWINSHWRSTEEAQGNTAELTLVACDPVGPWGLGPDDAPVVATRHLGDPSTVGPGVSQATGCSNGAADLLGLGLADPEQGTLRDARPGSAADPLGIGSAEYAATQDDCTDGWLEEQLGDIMDESARDALPTDQIGVKELGGEGSSSAEGPPGLGSADDLQCWGSTAVLEQQEPPVSDGQGALKKRRFNVKDKGCEMCGGPCPRWKCTEVVPGSDLRNVSCDAADSFARAVRARRDTLAAAEPPKYVSAARKWNARRSGPGRLPLGFGHVPDWLRENPVIGNVTLHSSHSLGWHRGLIWCWTCGLYSTGVPIGLKILCDGESLSGTKNLERLRKGRPPQKVLDWPLEGED